MVEVEWGRWCGVMGGGWRLLVGARGWAFGGVCRMDEGVGR